MAHPVLQVLLYALGPAAAMASIGSIASFRAPIPRLSVLGQLLVEARKVPESTFANYPKNPPESNPAG